MCDSMREFTALSPIVELRVAGQEVSGDGSVIVEGYAATFDQPYTLWNGRDFTWIESIAPGAFRDVLASTPLVHLNIGHDMNQAIAASNVAGIGGLTLKETERGLWFSGRCDPEDVDVQRAVPKLRRGVWSQASFAFTVEKVETTTTEDDNGRVVEHSRIASVRDLFDVCVCAQGANPNTESFVRSVHAAYHKSRTPDGVGSERRLDLGGVEGVAPAVGAGIETSFVALAQARKRAMRLAQKGRKGS